MEKKRMIVDPVLVLKQLDNHELEENDKQRILEIIQSSHIRKLEVWSKEAIAVHSHFFLTFISLVGRSRGERQEASKFGRFVLDGMYHSRDNFKRVMEGVQCTSNVFTDDNLKVLLQQTKESSYHDSLLKEYYQPALYAKSPCYPRLAELQREKENEIREARAKVLTLSKTYSK